MGQGLLNIEASRSHSDTPHSVGLLWTCDQLEVQTCTRQHTTFIADSHSFPWRDSNPHSQQASGPQTHALDRAATGTGTPNPIIKWFTKIRYLKNLVSTNRNLAAQRHCLPRELSFSSIFHWTFQLLGSTRFWKRSESHWSLRFTICVVQQSARRSRLTSQ